MIASREFRIEDIGSIDEIYHKQSIFGIPGLDNVIINSTLVDDSGKIVGYGAVKLFAEAVVLLDPELRKRDKALAIREAMKTAITYCKDAGLEYLYMISNLDGFTQVLRKRYCAKGVPGSLLMIDLTDRENSNG
jgi:hypothetical protein